MTIFHFTIVLKNTIGDLEGITDSLFDAGCDDALVCSYHKTIYLEFDRESVSAHKAIASAIDDIKSAGFDVASVLESGFAAMADVANLAGLTRSAINQYAKGSRGEGTFPEPIFGLTSSSPLYSWPEVAEWLHDQGKIDDVKYEVALAAKEFGRFELSL